MYQVNHPRNRIYCNTRPVAEILRRIGNPGLLTESERQRREAQIYLAALNRGMSSGSRFTGGVDFHGEILIRFRQGQHIWRLDWQTTEPGLTLYRWTRSQERYASEEAAYRAGQWVVITEQEMQQYGGWVAQAVEGMVSRREALSSLSGTVGIAIDIIGSVAVGVFSGVISGQMGARPPVKGGGQVVPFPAKAPPATPVAPLPAASGM
jgi:hypothetical protein